VSIKAEYPDLLAAHSIYAGSRDDRVELESRILAQQSLEEISECLGITIGSVEEYLSIFFDVRDRLESKTYVVTKVIGPTRALNPQHFMSMEGLTKTVAYYGGIGAMEAVWPYLRSDGRLLAQLTNSEMVLDPFAERLAMMLQAASLPTAGVDARRVAQHYYDLAKTFSTNVSGTNLIGCFSHIAEPFPGELWPERTQNQRQASWAA
jgi:hypothetical protein